MKYVLKSYSQKVFVTKKKASCHTENYFKYRYYVKVIFDENTPLRHIHNVTTCHCYSSLILSLLWYVQREEMYLNLALKAVSESVTEEIRIKSINFKKLKSVFFYSAVHHVRLWCSTLQEEGRTGDLTLLPLWRQDW